MEKIIRNDAGEIVAQVDGDNETFYTKDELIEAGQLEPEEEPSDKTETSTKRRRAQTNSGTAARKATFGEKMLEWERDKDSREEARWEERLGSED